MATLKTGGPTLVGTIITIPRTELVDIGCAAGADWLFLDMEHGSIGAHDLGALVAASSVPVFVRIPVAEPYFVKLALDSGADGVVCPQVDSGAIAARMVSAGKYSPFGSRSVGIGRAQNYGLDFAGYLKGANSATQVIVQVESIAAVRDIEDIVAVEGLGGIFLGPYDLSATMGRPGEIDHPEVVEAVNRVIEVCRDRGIAIGQFFGKADAALRSRSNLDFMVVGVETGVLAAALSSEISTLRAT